MKKFEGKKFSVFQEGKREWIDHPGAVILLPFLDPETILLIRNERFVISKTLWELPAGTIEPSEPPEATASRELAEETGYTAQKITFLTQFYTSPGYCNEVMYAYVAEGLTFQGQNLDENEKIEVEAVPWKKVPEMIKGGIIDDGKTLTTLLYYRFLYES